MSRGSVEYVQKLTAAVRSILNGGDISSSELRTFPPNSEVNPWSFGVHISNIESRHRCFFMSPLSAKTRVPCVSCFKLAGPTSSALRVMMQERYRFWSSTLPHLSLCSVSGPHHANQWVSTPLCFSVCDINHTALTT